MVRYRNAPRPLVVGLLSDQPPSPVALLGAGLWPLLGIRAGSLVAAIAVLVPTFRSMRLARSSLPCAAGAGTLDIAANALYLAAAYHGALSVVGPIASLYPAGTVLLAVVVDAFSSA